MRIDLPLGSECLLPDGRLIEPVDAFELDCDDCCLRDGSLCREAPCTSDQRKDDSAVSFREIIMVADQGAAGSPY